MASLFSVNISVKLFRELLHRLNRDNFLEVLDDLRLAGWQRKWQWIKEGFSELGGRMRTSWLGPFAFIAPLAFWSLVLGVIYGLILGQDLTDYLAYLAVGLTLWRFITSCLLDSEGLFIAPPDSLELTKPPLSGSLFHMTWVNIAILFLQICFFLLVCSLFDLSNSTSYLQILAALVFLWINSLWLSLLIGILSLRIPDFKKHLTRFLPLLFLLSPILWKAEMVQGWEFGIYLNPIYFLLDVTRSVLLGFTPAPSTLHGAALISFFGWSVTLLIFTLFYRRLPYWAWAGSHRPFAALGANHPFYSSPPPIENDTPIPIRETPPAATLSTLPLRPLAFYLPQFHPIAENDAWWGKGFTEWTNVTRAQPQFVGHHQPRLPGDLGFYDLRLPEIQAEQIRLARQYGIYGFCYHYYWFGGKRLLDRPLRQVLADPSLDLPFCLCWANENWTRRWDGEDQEILIGQQHSPDDDLAFIRALVPVFRDPRYIQVDGKPLLLVYRPQILPDPAATVARWRQELADQGEPGLFLAAVQSFRDALGRDDTLFDALVEFPPHGVPRVPVSGMQLLNPHFRGELLDYEACVAAAEAQVDLPGDKLVFPGIMTAWDNTARRQDQATIFAHASPAAYGRWLTACCRRALAQPAADRRLVFINAWNEWAEGSYLEPDRRYGYAYLQATRDALLDAAAGFPTTAANRPTGANPRLLFVGHDAHRHGAQLLTLHLVRLFARRFGYRVRLWLLGDGALRPDYEALAEVERLDPEPEHLVPAARRLRAEGIDQAIVNTVVSAAVLPALDQAGMKTLALIHELPQLIQERGLVDNARAVAAHATTVLFAADTVRQAFATLAPLVSARTRVLPQGIYQDLTAPADARAQVARALGLPADAILVINVGYGDTRKGFDLFLDTARLTVTADPRFHFLWLGQVESGWQPRLERERQRAPLIGHLHQLAFTPDVGRYYAAADIFLLSSREDPFPSVVLEALACGVPVVAAAGTGGHGELLADPLNGTLAGACGEVQALDLALRDLAAGEAQDPSRRARRAATARARFDFVAYGWELLRQLAPGLQCVSVVVPNYNYARYLRARLASILGQSYPVFEILVLDDASTDDSTQVVAACQRDWDRDITLIVNDRNSGSVFAQWRQGIDRARGDLLWIAEADDLAMPDFLASLAPRFAATPSLTMAFVDAAQIDSAGQRLGDSYAAYCGEYSALDFHRDFSVSGATFLTQGLGVRNTVLNVSGVLFRRAALVAALARVGTELERWTIAGDWRLYCELCRAGGEVHYVAQPLNQHRRHAASVVGTNALPQHLAEITAMHELLAQDLQQETLISQWQSDYLRSLSVM